MVAFSRRDFLKLSGLGFLGLWLPNLPLDLFFQDAFEAQEGRVAARLIWLYDQPSFNARRTKLYWRDSVLPISNVSISEDASDYNRVWYQIGDEGYAYSGTLQPVRTILNTPRLDVPDEGLLGEVSVPYTDAHVRADDSSYVAYRMYYETIHWVMYITTDLNGKAWYQVLDDKRNEK